MFIWNNRKLAKALDIDIPYSFNTNILQFNSKDVKPGDLFIALKGNNGDGHDYVQDALHRGASAVIVNENFNNFFKNKIILVPDTYQALLKLAHYKRSSSNAKFIGITGSVGKTTTKEMMKHVISSLGNVFASRYSFNNYLGISLDLASLHQSTEFAIFEMGMSMTGEIAVLSKLVKPDIAIINNIAPVHLKNFNNLEEILYSKAEIFIGLSGKKTAIISHDIEEYDKLYNLLKETGITEIYTFGYHTSSSSKILSYSDDSETSKIVLDVLGKKINVVSKLVGPKKATNIAVVLLLCDLLNFDLQNISEKLASFDYVQRRGNIIYINDGKKVYSIIDESYNSSPVTLQEALLRLKNKKAKNKIAILGDMKELGIDSDKYHLDVLPWLLDAKVDKVVTIGELMKNLYKKLPMDKIHFDSVDQSLNSIDDMISDQDVVLCKGSRSMRLYHIVKYLSKKNVI